MKSIVILALLMVSGVQLVFINGFIDTVRADLLTPTITTNDATGIEETNATLQGTLIDDGGEECIVGFEYGLTTAYGNIQIISDSYIYAAGETTQMVYQYWKSNLTKKAETEDYDGVIFALAEDSMYVYAGGFTTQKVYQYWKSNMTKKAETGDYGGCIFSLTQDSTYIYAGGEGTERIYQYWKSNLTKKAETEDYTETIFSLTNDKTYVYAGGGQKVCQYWKSNLTKKAETGDYGGGIVTIEQDSNYIYAGGDTTNKVFQYWKTNMTKKAETGDCGEALHDIIQDRTYIYAGGGGAINKVLQYWKSNLTKKAETEDYGNTIWSIAQDNTYVYAGGEASQKVYQYWKSNMTKKAETEDYEGILYSLDTLYYTTGITFSCNIGNLTPGVTYHFRAFASNSNGTNNGLDGVFLTKPNFVFSSENPVNGSTRLRPSFLWSINISDPDGDLFNWTIECSNGQSNSSTNDTNGTKQVSLSGLSHFMIYVVWVNATDQHGLETKEWFVFTTKKAVITEKKLVSKHPLVDTNGLEDGEGTPSIPGFELPLCVLGIAIIILIRKKYK